MTEASNLSASCRLKMEVGSFDEMLFAFKASWQLMVAANEVELVTRASIAIKIFMLMLKSRESASGK